LVVQRKKIFAGAFMDGNNNVILGISSMIRENEWNAVFAESNDMQWYIKEDEDISM
jgi:hypothetical protein